MIYCIDIIFSTETVVLKMPVSSAVLATI